MKKEQLNKVEWLKQQYMEYMRRRKSPIEHEIPPEALRLKTK